MLLTQPNTRPAIATYSSHTIPFSGMCPISGNPQPGSLITISYRALTLFLEVDSLQHYINSYKGGKGDIRDMEGMIQQIAEDCARTIQTRVFVKAMIHLQRGASMTVTAVGRPE